MIDQQKLTALINWLIAGAPPQTDFEATVAELGQRLTDAGIPIALLNIFNFTINPLISGKRTNWTPGGGVRVREASHEAMASSFFIGTVADASNTANRMIRHRIGQDPAFDAHPSSTVLIERNYSEYTIIPLPAVHEPNASLGVGTKRTGGLTDDELAALSDIAAPLARVVESQSQRANIETLLATYVGRDASRRVLDGRIRRGESELIPAVILFADLIGFTALSNSRPPDDVIAKLNRFFEAIETPIRENRGEVLKLIGDGVLAIFPTPDDVTAQEAAAKGAILAIDEARAALTDAPGVDFRASLHVGDIHYGNIGSATRLDFTAIGPAVNLAARMLGAAGEKNIATVCSAEFAALAPDRAPPLGAFDFKGFDAPAMVHAIN